MTISSNTWSWCWRFRFIHERPSSTLGWQPGADQDQYCGPKL